MAKKKAGRRYALILYQHFWARLWKSTLLFGLILLLIWVVGVYGGFALLDAGVLSWFLFAGLISLLITIIGLIARRLSYVQAREDHLRLVTPFFPMKVSYRRIVTNRATALGQLFPPKETRGARRRFLEPFYGRTAVVVQMKGTPLPAWAMRLFLSEFIFRENPPRLILLVEDWMKFSTELDSYFGAWRERIAYQRHRKKVGRPHA